MTKSQFLTGVFIEPQGSLLELLGARKRWLEQAMPGQAYVSHPAHCTLVFGNYGPIAAWLGKLRQTVAAQPVFELETDAWQEFPGDALAGGGHTVACRARLSPGLTQLQQVVAESLAP